MGEAKRRRDDGTENPNIGMGVWLDHIDAGAESDLEQRTDTRATRCLAGLHQVMVEVAQGSHCAECNEPITTPDELGSCSVAQWNNGQAVVLGIPFCCSCTGTPGLAHAAARRIVRGFLKAE
jgi:hypothetical protein